MNAHVYKKIAISLLIGLSFSVKAASQCSLNTGKDINNVLSSNLKQSRDFRKGQSLAVVKASGEDVIPANIQKKLKELIEEDKVYFDQASGHFLFTSPNTKIKAYIPQKNIEDVKEVFTGPGVENIAKKMTVFSKNKTTRKIGETPFDLFLFGLENNAAKTGNKIVKVIDKNMNLHRQMVLDPRTPMYKKMLDKGLVSDNGGQPMRVSFMKGANGEEVVLVGGNKKPISASDFISSMK